MSLSQAPISHKTKGARRPWWIELGAVAVFYFVYEWIAGITAADKRQAFGNAYSELHLERTLGIFREAAFQHLFLKARWLIKLCNDYYTTVHFAVPVLALFILYRYHSSRYRIWRNAFAWMTLISLAIFVLLPVAPPRLLPSSFGFTDTIATMGGAGPLDAYLMNSVGDPYAAMPSLHFAWAAWSAMALAPVLRNRWLRLALWLDPIITTFVIIVTANHFFLDVVAGGAVLGAGVYLSRHQPWRTKPTRESILESGTAS